MIPTHTELYRLLPAQPIDFVGVRPGEPCPHCGDERVTDCIWNFVTGLCGSSHLFDEDGWHDTPCQGKYFLPFIVREK